MVRTFATAILVIGTFTHSSPAETGKTVRGIVTDAETGERLPVAPIRIVGTRSGTITNSEGVFSLKIPNVPADIEISSIGYSSQRITITDDTPEKLEIALVPSPIMMETVIVSADDEANRIMEKVIARKREWRAALLSYRANAYTRVVVENTTRIVMIAESISEISWDREKGIREVVKSKRQTSNLSVNENFAFSIDTTNFYDDDINIAGYRVIGPTNPDALRYYDFRLSGRRIIDGSTVFDIEMKPRSRLQPLLTGTLSVLDGDFAMIEIDAGPGDAILFPRPLKIENLTFRQQFSNYGGDVWLPVDFRTSADISIRMPGLRFPLIKARKLTRLTDYDVNVSLADSLFVKKRKPVSAIISNESVVVSAEKGEGEAADSPESLKPGEAGANVRPAAGPDSLFTGNPGVIPLTDEEETAYAIIDSTLTLEKVFKPEGFLAKKLSSGKEKEKKAQSPAMKLLSKAFSGFSPRARHNRVEGFALGMEYTKTVRKQFTAGLSGAYLTGQKRWSFGGEATYRPGRHRRSFITLSYKTGIETRYHSALYPLMLNSLETLYGRDDYFDYYRTGAASIRGGYRFGGIHVNVSAAVNDEIHRSVDKSTDFSLINRRHPQRENPPIHEGRLRSAEATVSWGDAAVPYGIIGQNRAELTIEHSSPVFLGGDFTFTRYDFTVDWRFNTFLRRRLIPPALDVRLAAGTSSGMLPIQRYGILDGALNIFSPFGCFRTMRDHHLEGESYCAVFWEHNFRTVPFELAGLRWLAERGTGIILHGAAGRTWISEQRLQNLSYRPFYEDNLRSEIGMSLNAFLGYFRIDVTKRLDRHGVSAGVSAARLF